MQNWGVWGERNSVYLRDVGRFLEGQHGTAGGGDDHHHHHTHPCTRFALSTRGWLAFSLSSCARLFSTRGGCFLHVVVAFYIWWLLSTRGDLISRAGADVGGERGFGNERRTTRVQTRGGCGARWTLSVGLASRVCGSADLIRGTRSSATGHVLNSLSDTPHGTGRSISRATRRAHCTTRPCLLYYLCIDCQAAA